MARRTICRRVKISEYTSKKRKNQNHNHDKYLLRRWNKDDDDNNNNNNNNNKDKDKDKDKNTKNSNIIRTANQTDIPVPVKDDLYTTNALNTLCTLDTSDPNKKSAATYYILILINIMIWNQPIVQHKTPNQSKTRSRFHHSIAVRYALIGVNEKLSNTPLHHQPAYKFCSNTPLESLTF